MERVDRVLVRQSERVAWKWFFVGGRKLQSCHHFTSGDKVYTPGVWYQASKKHRPEMHAADGNSYDTGFHAFVTRRDARRQRERARSDYRWKVLRKVLLKGHITEGRQDGNAVVGSRMLVLPTRKGGGA